MRFEAKGLTYEGYFRVRTKEAELRKLYGLGKDDELPEVVVNLVNNFIRTKFGEVKIQSYWKMRA